MANGDVGALVNESIRLFNNGKWGKRGFGMPYYPSGKEGEVNTCTASNNADVVEVHDDIGKQVLFIATQPDGMSSAPPKLRTLILVHKLVQRYRSVIAGEIVQTNEIPPGPVHIGANATPFLIHPCPYFNLRNKWMKRWVGLVLQTLSEIMQHQTNIYPVGIYSSLIRDTRFGLDMLYSKLGTQFFGKDKTWAADPANTLTDADFKAYNEDNIFISNERIDRRAGILTLYSDQDLSQLVDGIPASIAIAAAAQAPYTYTEPDQESPTTAAAADGGQAASGTTPSSTPATSIQSQA